MLQPIGLYSCSYDSGIEIFKLDEDYAVFRWIYSDGTQSKIIKAKINYPEFQEEYPYFITKSHIISINGIVKLEELK